MTIQELSNMTDTELNTLAAKCMGWTYSMGRWMTSDGALTEWVLWSPSTCLDHAFELQDKACERDDEGYIQALAQAVQNGKRSKNQQRSAMCTPVDFITATARQRCIAALAVLSTLGL